MQLDLQAKTIEVVNQGVVVSLPYVENSIEKVTWIVEGEYFTLTIIPRDGLLFREGDVIFISSDCLGFLLPMLRKNELREIELTKDDTTTPFVISIPYNSGSIKQVSPIVGGNYLHIVLYGSIASSFDESKVKFARLLEEASVGELQESGST
jgi:hypothetical protein